MSTHRKDEVGPLSLQHLKTKTINDLSLRVKTVRVLRRERKSTLRDPGLGNGPLTMTQAAEEKTEDAASTNVRRFVYRRACSRGREDDQLHGRRCLQTVSLMRV